MQYRPTIEADPRPVGSEAAASTVLQIHRLFAQGISDAEYCEILSSYASRGAVAGSSAFHREATALMARSHDARAKRDLLRRWKARETLHIALRDLSGQAALPTTACALSDLADACVQAAYDLALSTWPAKLPPPFAVIALGPLGGRELNYQSALHLLFVHHDAMSETVLLNDGRKLDALTYLNRVIEMLVKVLAEEGGDRPLFRVDLRLRPEGRFGPLTRALSSCRDYYEHWAESNELAELTKARYVAGDKKLGVSFLRMVVPFVYRRLVSPAFLKEIEADKRRVEQRRQLEGQGQADLRTGRGGVEDIEFAVRCLQLEHGGKQPSVRAANTLEALQRLCRAGFISRWARKEIKADYLLLRKLEHRLQLLQGVEAACLPPPEAETERMQLARGMGFTDCETFAGELTTHRTRAYERRLRALQHLPEASKPTPAELPAQDAWAGVEALLDNIDSPAAQEELSSRLTAGGFHNVVNALRALQMPMIGNEFGSMLPDTAREFKAIARRLLALLERSPDPDAGLAGIETLALAVPRRAQLYAAFDDCPQMMHGLVQLAASAPPMLKLLANHQEWMDTLLSSDATSEFQPPMGLEGDADDPSGLRRELADRLRRAESAEAKLKTLARFYLRETLCIAARSIWGRADVHRVMQELTQTADVMIQALVDLCIEPLAAAHPDPEFAQRVLRRAAVVGLGKLGGAELSFSSDWDLLLVYNPERRPRETESGREQFALVNALAERFLAAGGALAAYGAPIEIDLRLRPWGSKGALIQTLDALIRYHRTEGETWERQAALKARFVAGCPEVGRRCERILHAVSFGGGLSAEQDAAIRSMKQRIETERLKPSERETDLKLGYGGLSDIEWLVQRLQLKHGRRRWTARIPNTLRALTALGAIHALDQSEVITLRSAYCLLAGLRNAQWLYTGSSQNTLTTDPVRRRVFSRMLGYGDGEDETSDTSLGETLRHQMQEVRCIFQRRFNSVDAPD